MNELLEDLITFAMEMRATDIHFILMNHILKIEFRTPDGLEPICQDIWTERFFEYLKFMAGFDLTNPYMPQSGQVCVNNVYCRFSIIINHGLQTGVLRILNTRSNMQIDELTSNVYAKSYFNSIIHQRVGLFIHSGPTNSGKTTTIHALLHEISLLKEHKIVSLEDPIEIEDPNYLQLQINEAQGFTYEKGIEELLRHDPDVIFIGETRNSYTAHMMIRAALTGHLVFTTIHAKNSLETIQRLLDFGIQTYELKTTISAIVSQRLYNSVNGKECVYEILKGKELHYAFERQKYAEGFETLSKQVKELVEKGTIQDKQALFDIQNI